MITIATTNFDICPYSPNFPTVKQVKTTKLEATGQILEYTETYKRGDYYKIKFISCDRDH